MFAIVDIETTGGSPTQSRITEVAVITHDGLSVVGSYSTLINPECKIPYSITKLTGITNSMVENAPKFYEIAKELYQMLEGKIFVAHNVSFDYNFIRNEYESLGGTFNAKKLCTVQLSRKLILGLNSYSLGNICKDLNIVVNGRHRALGDATATAKLFDILLEKKNNHTTYKNFNIDEMGIPKLNSFRKNLVEKLPEKTGVYYFYNKESEVIYVGKSNNIKSRVLSHLSNTRSKKGIHMINAIHDVDCVVTGSEMVALLLENSEIKKIKPFFNRAKKRSLFNYGIQSSIDSKGYLSLKVVKAKSNEEVHNSFSSLDQANSFLYQITDNFTLCQKVNGLYESGNACFHYQVKKCNGACVGDEAPDEYNLRAAEALKKLGLENNSFLLIDKGREQSEKSVVYIENGRYKGFGFIKEEADIKNIDALVELITSYPDDRDAQSIIMSFMNSKNATVVDFKTHQS